MQEERDKHTVLSMPVDIMDSFYNLNTDGPGLAAGQEALAQKLHPAGQRVVQVAREHRSPQELRDPNVLPKFFLWLLVPNKLLLVTTTFSFFHFWNAEFLFSSRVSLRREGNSASSQNPFIHPVVLRPEWVLRDPQTNNQNSTVHILHSKHSCLHFSWKNREFHDSKNV